MNLFESIESNISRNIKYYSLKDLLNNPYAAIFHISSSYVSKVYCYDISKLIPAYNKMTGLDVLVSKANLKNYDLNLIKNQENPIIFTIFIRKKDEHLPKNTGEVHFVVSQSEVKGSNVIYPIATALSGGKMISDRDSVSDEAEWVWKKFFNNTSGIKKFKAIDNIEFPVTPEKDDDSIYNVNNIIQNNPDLNYDILNNLKFFLEYGEIKNKNKDLIIDIIDSKMTRNKKIKEISKLFDLKKFLNQILNFSPLNFIYQDTSSQINKTMESFKKLVIRNNYFLRSNVFKQNFNSKETFYHILQSFSEKLYVKRSSGII